jgi:FAD/FMN-containing dehydrogenase
MPSLEPCSGPPHAARVRVNDIHSRLNLTTVGRIDPVHSRADIVTAVKAAASAGEAVCVAGGRHAMGGQQFARGARLLDTRGLRRVLDLDVGKGLVRVQAGIQWPELITELHRRQRGHARPWGIVQKQTGADRLSIGGAVAANIHGRGLTLRPFVQDVEEFELVNAEGDLLRCARDENPTLFNLVVGGYGLFGVVATLTLRLQRRHVLERVVEIGDCDDLMSRFDRRIAAGHRYGDFQFAIDASSDDFLSRGVFSCYRPVEDARSAGRPEHALDAGDWR